MKRFRGKIIGYWSLANMEDNITVTDIGIASVRVRRWTQEGQEVGRERGRCRDLEEDMWGWRWGPNLSDEIQVILIEHVVNHELTLRNWTESLFLPKQIFRHFNKSSGETQLLHYQQKKSVQYSLCYIYYVCTTLELLATDCISCVKQCLVLYWFYNQCAELDMYIVFGQYNQEMYLLIKPRLYH